MLKILAIAALLFGAPAAYSQTVASCPTATPGSTWNPTTQWLKCSDLTYIAEPIPATALINDMHCGSTGCVFSWQLGPKVLPSDQVWVETTAKPKGTWVSASTLKFGGATQNCTKLIYIGAPQSYIIRDYNGAGINAYYNAPIIGTVTLTAPLSANLTNVVVTPAAWDFSTQDPTLTSTLETGPNAPSFAFSTDGSGNITAWAFSLGTHDGATDVLVEGTSTPYVSTGLAPGPLDPGNYYDSVDKEGSPEGAVLDTQSTAIGSWYCLAPL